MGSLSAQARSALHHLNQIKPYDGWSINTYETTDGARNKTLLLLRRRSIPLSESGFDDIVYDKRSGTIVGVLSLDDSSAKKKAVILVERDGTVSRRKQQIEIEYAREVPSTTNHRSTETSISSEQNKQILQYGGGILAAAILLNVFSDVIQLLSLCLSILLLPFLIIAAMTCPDISTFDAKKELKRVLRGQHLPENHPEKPKGWFAETTNRIAASLAGEIATGLGYEVTHQPLICAIFTKVTLNSIDSECYWIGAFNKWYFIMQRKLNTPQQ